MCIDICIDMPRKMRTDFLIGLHIDMHTGMCAGICTDTRAGMCAHMRTGVHMNMSIDKCIGVCTSIRYWSWDLCTTATKCGEVVNTSWWPTLVSDPH